MIMTHIKSAYNRSMKVTMELHFSTDRELIEPLTKCKHVKVFFYSEVLADDQSDKKII